MSCHEEQAIPLDQVCVISTITSAGHNFNICILEIPDPSQRESLQKNFENPALSLIGFCVVHLRQILAVSFGE